MSYDEQRSQDDDLEDLQEQYGTRDGTIFVIDATESMFSHDTAGEICFFQQCIKRYIEILLEKLVWNSQDWMGLVLFGTGEWDMDPETKYIKTIHKLSPISVETLKEATSIADEKWQYYETIATKSDYPLNDVLWHVAEAFSFVKITMPIRRVILLTCQDNPPIKDDEKHCVRVRISKYNDIGLKFCVVGLSKDWKQELFYKDLEMLSGKIDEEDYQRTRFEDLIEQVKFPSRTMATLPWRLGKDVAMDVSINSLCIKSKYLKKQRINRETNEPVISNTRLARESGFCDDDGVKTEEEEEEEHDNLGPSHIFPSEVRKMHTYGGRNIYFTLHEVKSLSNISEIGIDVICVKPIAYSPLFHYKAPYFATCAKKSSRKDNTMLFAALLHKCELKRLMIICMVTFRQHSPPNLCSMIPDEENGGFYLYCIPYQEHVRDLTPHLTDFIYDDPDKLPVDGDLVALFKKILKEIRIKYDPTLFPNPKLQGQQQKLKNIALELDDAELPPDSTVPRYEMMKQRLGSLIDQYKKMVLEKQDPNDGPPAKKAKKSQNSTKMGAVSDITIADRVKEKTVEQCTVVQLKEFLKSLDLKTSGTKSDLIKRIYEHYG